LEWQRVKRGRDNAREAKGNSCFLSLYRLLFRWRETARER